MSMQTSIRRQLQSNGKLIAVAALFLLVAGGFLGVIAFSMIPPSPSEEHFDLFQRLREARASAVTAEEIRTLDSAANILEAARQEIERQSERAWTLRSFARARTLLGQAEILLEEVDPRSPPDDSPKAKPD